MSTYEKYFQKITKFKDFKLEEILKQMSYIDRLKYFHMPDLEILYKNNLPEDFILMVTYLFIRAELGKFMTINYLTKPVIDILNSTFLDILPKEVPTILKNGVYIQAKHFTLFNNITKIILYNEQYLAEGYSDFFGIYLFKTNGTFMSASMSYSWILGKGVEEIDMAELKNESNDTNAMLFRKALAFCFIFAILLDAENTPTVVKDTNKSINFKKGNNIEKKLSDGWIEKTIYLNRKYESTSNNIIHATLYKDDKILKEVKVKGFLRRQLCGKNLSEYKYIYIKSYTSTRWVTEGNKKITYYLK
jgi:hypothetical protein